MDQEHARGIAGILRERLGVTRGRRHLRRAVRVGEDQRVRRRAPPVDRRRAHGVRRGRHPAPARRRLRDQHRHRPLLPAGGRPAGALDRGARRARPRTCSSPTTRGCARSPAASPSSGGTACAASRRRWRTKRGGGASDDGGGEIGDDRELDAAAAGEGEDGQLSLFTAISAVPLDEQGRRLDGVRRLRRRAGRRDPHRGRADLVGAARRRRDGDRPLPLHPRGQRAAPPRCRCPIRSQPADGDGRDESQAKTSALARRRQLREQNSAAVADLVHSTGKSHATLERRTEPPQPASAASARPPCASWSKRLELAKGMMRRIPILSPDLRPGVARGGSRRPARRRCGTSDR